MTLDEIRIPVNCTPLIITDVDGVLTEGNTPSEKAIGKLACLVNKHDKLKVAIGTGRGFPWLNKGPEGVLALLKPECLSNPQKVRAYAESGAIEANFNGSWNAEIVVERNSGFPDMGDINHTLVETGCCLPLIPLSSVGSLGVNFLIPQWDADDIAIAVPPHYEFIKGDKQSPLVYGTPSISKNFQPTIEFVRYSPNAHFTPGEALNPHYDIKSEISSRLEKAYGGSNFFQDIQIMGTSVNLIPHLRKGKIGKDEIGKRAYSWATEKCNSVNFVLVIGDSGSDKDMKEGAEETMKAHLKNGNAYFCYVGEKPLPNGVNSSEDIILEKGPSAVIEILDWLENL